MDLFPADAEAKLGFDRVRARLDALASSDLGRERLAAMAPTTERRAVETLLARTAELQAALRTDGPLPLAPLPDVREALRRAKPVGAMLDGEELAEIAALLGTMRRVQAHVRARRVALAETARLALDIEPPKELEDHLNRIVDPRGHVRDDASPELSRIARALIQTQDALRAALLRALRAAARDGHATEDQPTIRNGRAVIPVRAEAKRKVAGFVHDVSGTGQTVYIEPAAALDLNNEVRELEAERAREIRRLLEAATAHVRSRRPQIEAGLDVLARLDALQARARLANELDALVPELNDAGHVRLVRGRNPALTLHVQAEAHETGGEARPVVPLDLELSDETRTLVITGPNAGGKSVALKTTGLLCLMASCGLPVPAAPGTTLPLFDRLFVDLGDQQSIENDLSTFTSHVANLRRMLGEADAGSLVLIDEAGTGTDPAEGGALAQAALEALTARGARTVATTHHGTLKAFAHETDHVENASMQFDQTTLAPTYRFQPGIPGSSYAFEIAERVGLDGDVLGRARALVGEGKASLEGLIARFEAETQALTAELDEARSERRRAEQTRKSFEGRERALKERTAQIERDALAEAERLVAEANARVERTIREIKESQAAQEQTREARAQLDRFKERVGQKKQKVEQRVAKKARRTAKPPEPTPDLGPITVGDRVRLDGNGVVGEVLEIDGREALVALGPMRTRAKLKRLTKVGGAAKQQVEVRAPTSSGGTLSALTVERRIDLRGERVDAVAPVVTRLLDDAIVANLETVEILHGTGTGALRQAVRALLRERTDVTSFEDAAWDAGGPGVTVARLR